MEITWAHYMMAIGAGVIAGVINTLAGSGSAVTLPMLVFLGLPADVANATNRVGVTIQNVVGITSFRQSKQLELSGALWLTIPAMLGSVVGTYVATILDARAMNTAIGVMLLIVLVTMFFDPKRWLRVQSEVKPGRPSLLTLLIFFLIGIYGGFIQAGVGVFILVAMVLGAGYTLVHANRGNGSLYSLPVGNPLGDWPDHGLGPEFGRVAGGEICRQHPQCQPLGAPTADCGRRLLNYTLLRHLGLGGEFSLVVQHDF
jgi:uncharacterized membrane protein YfcA